MLVLPGVLVTAAITGVAAALVFGLPADAALLDGRGACAHRSGDPDPPVLTHERATARCLRP